MAIVEAHLIMGVSERKLAQGHALLVYATVRELEKHGLLKERVSLDTVEACPILCLLNIITVSYSP